MNKNPKEGIVIDSVPDESPVKNFAGEVEMTELRGKPKLEKISEHLGVTDFTYAYQSESPDEIALLDFANKVGVQFICKVALTQAGQRRR